MWSLVRLDVSRRLFVDDLGHLRDSLARLDLGGELLLLLGRGERTSDLRRASLTKLMLMLVRFVLDETSCLCVDAAVGSSQCGRSRMSEGNYWV